MPNNLTLFTSRHGDPGGRFHWHEFARTMSLDSSSSLLPYIGLFVDSPEQNALRDHARESYLVFQHGDQQYQNADYSDANIEASMDVFVKGVGARPLGERLIAWALLVFQPRLSDHDAACYESLSGAAISRSCVRANDPVSWSEILPLHGAKAIERKLRHELSTKGLSEWDRSVCEHSVMGPKSLDKTILSVVLPEPFLPFVATAQRQFLLIASNDGPQK